MTPGRPTLGSTPEDFRVGIFCAKCLRRHGATTLLAVLSLSVAPGARWRWSRVARSRGARTATAFKRSTDNDFATGGAELECQRCGAHPRVNLDRLATDADATRRAGASAISV